MEHPSASAFSCFTPVVELVQVKPLVRVHALRLWSCPTVWHGREEIRGQGDHHQLVTLCHGARTVQSRGWWRAACPLPPWHWVGGPCHTAGPVAALWLRLPVGSQSPTDASPSSDKQQVHQVRLPVGAPAPPRKFSSRGRQLASASSCRAASCGWCLGLAPRAQPHSSAV